MLKITQEKPLSADERFEKEIQESGLEFQELKICRYLPIIACIFHGMVTLLISYAVFLLASGVVSYLHIRENNGLIYTALIVPLIYAINKNHSRLFKSIFTRFAISDKMVIYKTGIFEGEIKRSYYKDWLHVDSHIYFWSKYFNYATIIIKTAYGYMAIDFVHNYCGVENALLKKYQEVKKAELERLNLS